MKLSHEKMVLRHLKDYGTLNCAEAFTFYNIHKLQDAIFKLKCKGYKFTRKYVFITNLYGEKHRIAEYSLKGDIEK